MQKQIADMEARLNLLIQKHNESRKDITALREDIRKLKKVGQMSMTKTPSKQDKNVDIPEVVKVDIVPADISPKSSTKPVKPEDKSRNIEEFIGGKLINFIGIGILVLGISMGIKYAIDNSMVGPLFRVIFGYAAGIGLVFLAWRLKAKYLFYSAVMLGGGVSILYFDTYAAFEYYQLLPYFVAFLLMLVITAFTVWAAVLYDLQIIGIIGLVGAYAVPILLSQESGRIHIFFSYMAIINTGILILAFRKNWRLLNHCAFALTWMIFTGWSIFETTAKDHDLTVISFASLFFLIFYASFLAYKLIHFEKFSAKDVILMIINAFIFYGIGYDWLDMQENGEAWLGLYTLGNAAIHFGISMLIYMRKQADRNVFYLIVSLALAFVAMAIPVQLDGNWVTLLWLFMGVSLFCIGHFREVSFYKSIGYAVIGLCFLSLLHDWMEAYPQNGSIILDDPIRFIFNMTFYTSVLTAGGVFAIFSLQRLKPSDTHANGFQKGIENYGIPALVLLISFLSLFLEIGQHFYNEYYASQQDIEAAVRYNSYILDFRYIWLVIYSLVFLSISSLLNQYYFKSSSLAKVLTVGGVIALIAYAIPGTGILNHLRDAFLQPDNATAFDYNWRYVGIRYITYVFAGVWIYLMSSQIKLSEWWEERKNYWILTLHLVILITLSSELVNIILLLSEQAAENLAYKVGLSILWTAYAVMLILLGIKRKVPIFRYSAFLLIGVTLIKVFFFDLSNTPTINRIMIFIGLGALLMLGAFVYQRYREEL